MWVCVVLNIIIILCLFWQNQSLKTNITHLQERIQEDTEESRHGQKELKQSLEYSVEAIQGDLNSIKAKEENDFETLSRQLTELGNYLDEFSTIKNTLSTVHEKCNFLQKNFDIIEELFRLQLVNSLIDDAQNAMNFYEDTQKRKNIITN